MAMHSLRGKWNQIVSVKPIATSFYATTSNNPKLKEQVYDNSVAEAKKVVGYSTSTLNVGWLLNDEIASSVIHIRKLISSNHPLVNTVKGLILNKEKLPWSLLISLVAKAGGYKEFASDDEISDVLHKQETLAQVAEMLKLSNILHKCIISLKNTEDTRAKFANAAGLLGGDYLLSKSYDQLARLKNQNLNDLISSAVRDIAESELVGVRDKKNNPLPSRPMPTSHSIQLTDEVNVAPIKYQDVLGHAKPEWMIRNILGGASLLGKSCQGALMLAGFDDNLQKPGYLIGKYLALSLYARKEYLSVFDNANISPISAPVLFHLQRHPSFYYEFEKLIDKDGEVDQDKLRSELQNSLALNDTKLFQKELCGRSLEVLSKFENSDAKTALKNIILSIEL